MRNWAVRGVGIMVCLAVVCCGVYSMFHEHSKWSVPVFAFGAATFFLSAWWKRSRRGIDFWTPLVFGLMFIAILIDVLTGISWPFFALSVPACIVSIVYLAYLAEGGWKARST